MRQLASSSDWDIIWRYFCANSIETKLESLYGKYKGFKIEKNEKVVLKNKN